MKGVAKLATNIKPMTGGGAIATLPVGGWVYGDVGSTDIMNFTHWYRPTGQRMELGVVCKATLTNLILFNEIEPSPQPTGTTPPPPTASFSAPDEIMARWQVGTGTSGEPIYTEYYYYDLRSS